MKSKIIFRNPVYASTETITEQTEAPSIRGVIRYQRDEPIRALWTSICSADKSKTHKSWPTAVSVLATSDSSGSAQPRSAKMSGIVRASTRSRSKTVVLRNNHGGCGLCVALLKHRRLFRSCIRLEKSDGVGFDPIATHASAIDGGITITPDILQVIPRVKKHRS